MKDILVRAVKTFVQGFLGALAVNLPSSDFSDSKILKSLIIGAVAGGISAVMNLIINSLNKKEE